MVTYHNRSDGKTLVIINVYVPCGYEIDDPTKFVKKVKFLDSIKDFVSKLTDSEYSVIVVGDMNVKSKLIDSAEAYENRDKMDFVGSWYDAPDKILFNSILDNILTDSFRYLYPNKLRCYTCWNAGLNARVNNYGTRIDYILISKSDESFIKSCEILSDMIGSDHCPISAEIEFIDIISSKIVPPECTAFYPELKGKQVILSDFMLKRKSNHLDQVPHKHLLQEEHCNKRQKLTKPSNSKQITQTKLKFSIKSSTHYLKDSEDFDNKHGSLTIKPVQDRSISVKSLLTGLPKPPFCSGHQIRALLKTVVKDGTTQGKRFYCCSLPIGPSSSKSSRCNFFQWLDK